jgi:2-keto-3-deoxy-6-phosphogluconate aldolase
MSINVNPVAAFYPVLRLPQAEIFTRDSSNLLGFYHCVIDAVADAASGFSGAKAQLEISLASPEIERCLSLLLDYASERDVEISLASLGTEEDYQRLATHNYGLQVFSPGVVDGLGLRSCASESLRYVPGVYTKHDFNLLTNFATQDLDCLTTIKVFPATASDAKEFAEFLEGPFPELKQARKERRFVAVSKDLREQYLMDKGFTMISSPSDYMMLREYFLKDSTIRMLAVEPADISPNDISGIELIKFLRAEFPDLKIIAAGITSLNDPKLLAKVFSSGANAIASAIFKMPLSRLQHGFELDDYPSVLAEMRVEMACELATIYNLIYNANVQVR